MDVLEAIKTRREISHYKDKSISTVVVENILEAAYLSPAGNNLPSREFILVTNSEVLMELANATPFVPWLRTAKAAIVVTGRPDVSKYWLQDASIASGYIWLAAVEQGLGAAFGAIYHSEDPVESNKRETFVKNTLSLPADRRIVSILGLGYPAKLPEPKKLVPRESIVFYETIK